MKNNQPVTNVEYQLRDDIAIISRTDSKGVIVDCNNDFVLASGFNREELIGQPHNILRHPDMPAEAFRDMWDTLKRGRPWSGIVKNRRKNGDFYWVKATATPLASGNGYVSVRMKPQRNEVQAAEALYQLMRSNPSIRLFEGVPASNKIISKITAFFGKIPRLLLKIQWILVLLLMGLASAGFYSLHSMQFATDQMALGKDVVADILPPPLYLIEARLVSEESLNASPSERTSKITKLIELKKEYDERIQYWSDSAVDPSVKASLLGEQRKYADMFWNEVTGTLIPALQANSLDQAKSSVGRTEEIYLQHRAGVDKTVKISNEFAAQKLTELSKTAERNRWLLIFAAALGSLMAVGVAVPVAAGIYRDLQKIEESAAAIAAGDLTKTLPHAGLNVMGDLISKITIMRNNLIELIASIHQSIDAVSQSATTLSSAARASATGSQKQSEASSNIAAAVEELSASIDQVEENARAAREISLVSGEKSEQGGRIIHNAANEMQLIASAVNSSSVTIGELEELSTKISSIVNVIKDIADQTNLLALNAAIEAARAGEQGRGFAVVADEVRKLAERTSRSTQEITSMIEKIRSGTKRAVDEMEAGVTRVNAGVTLAKQAGDSITEIRSGSDHVARSVDTIQVALQEQATSTREIAARIATIAQGSEANAVSASQTASAAMKLEELSDELNGVASLFRIT